MTATVTVRFRDRFTWRLYEVGDQFDGTDGRVAELAALGIVAVAVDAPAESVDLSALTVEKLRELCADRGIEVPKRATKAQLIALLDE